VTPPPRAAAPAGPVVAVVGRPNVGKSTLVNRLTGRRQAIVEQKPGVTRDRTTHQAHWRGDTFTVVDTGGWLPDWSPGRDRIAERVAEQAEFATEAADLVLFVVDATVGVTEEDAAVARWLRNGQLPVLVVANKIDELGDPQTYAGEVAGLHGLGLGEPVPVSALHGRGSGDLLDEIHDRLRSTGAFDRGVEPADDVPGVALIGRPNVGKSSLFNRLVGEQRAIVDERPGTTRDAVDTVVELPGGRRYRFVDTAGLRRRARMRRTGEATEYFSTVRTVEALESAAVALLVLDAGEPVGEQDQRLARQILDAGRALVVVLNKWDLVDDYRRDRLRRERDRMLGFIDFAPLVRTSALTRRGLERILPAVDRVLEQWHRRIPTAPLNDWLSETVAATAPPMVAGRSVRLRYITQVGVGPPTFRVFTTGELTPAYLRYLERRLREAFGFEGTPLHLGVRIRARWEEREPPTERTAKATAARPKGRKGASPRGRPGRGR
jgi:GTPase